jgi:hypothetical protein
VQPYAFALNWSPNCLFKWQVIPTKQITPAAAWAYVVFLQQIVALPTKAPLPNKGQGCPNIALRDAQMNNASVCKLLGSLLAWLSRCFLVPL